MTKPTGKPTERQDEEESTVKRRQAPGRTIEARENQIINDAIDLAAKQIRKGTVTSQVHSHFLKLGSTVAQLEKEKLRNENLLLQAKAEALKSQKKVEELYAKAMSAFRLYNGQEEEIQND